jgi:hypothetical protein
MNIKDFLTKNAWGIIGVIVVMVTFYSLTNYRLTRAEEKLAQYPSQDYFELKFKTVDDKLIELNQKITDHIDEK